MTDPSKKCILSHLGLKNSPISKVNAGKKFGDALSKDLKHIKSIRETKEQLRSSKESFASSKGEFRNKLAF